MKVKVRTEQCTLGAVGDEVDVDDTPAMHALIAAGHLSAVKASAKQNKTGK